MKLRGWILLGSLVFLIALARVSNFFTDDSYIHLVFARNLAAGAGFSFNPGEAVYGFTSPLWVLLLAAGHALVPDWLLLARLFGALFTVLAVAFTARLARAAGATTVGAAAAAAALAFHGWFLRWSLSGMETSLAAFLVAAGLEGLLRGGQKSARGMFLISLAALARPEALLLLALAALWSARGKGRGRWPALAGLALGAGCLGAWEFWIHRATGSWIPTSFSAKRAHEALSLLGIARPTWHFFGVVGLTDVVAVVVAAGAFLILRRRRQWTPALALLCAWPCALAALYLLTRFQMISRYWVPALPALLVAATVGAEKAFTPKLNLRLRCAYFLQQAGVLLVLVYPGMDAFSRGLEEGPARIGRWLRENSAPGALVATPDIGAIGFYSQRKVLDLGGLVTPAMGALLASHDLSEITRDGLYRRVAEADYLVDRDPRAGALIGPGRHLVLAARVENLGLSRPQRRFYSLYRVDAPGNVAAPGPAAPDTIRVSAPPAAP